MSILNLFKLNGKVSIVTGGGDGLGRSMAIGLAEAGSDIVVCSRKLEKCEETAQTVEDLGRKALALRCDITKDHDIDNIITQTLQRFKKIDVLVNNSGRTWGATPEEFALKDWQKVIDVNITGTFLVAQRAGREMIKQKHGKIINISSYAGLGGTNPDCLNAIPYNTSKGAVVIFTKDLATKWAKYHINVNCIAPGWFPTRMTNWILENKGDQLTERILLKRFGHEDDIKATVVYLSSKASDYVTGQVLCLDGGLTTWY